MKAELYKRSLLKTITYRLLGSTVNVFITYYLTKRMDISLGVGIADLIVKPAIYFLHELFWSKIK